MSQETRGHAIKRRRLAHGIDSLRDFAKETGVSRNAITAAEGGSGSEGTYDRLEAWLDRFDETTGASDVKSDDLVTFQLTGNFGVDVTVKGPVANLAELEAAVERLLAKMGRLEE